MIEPLGIALEIGNRRRALAARLSPQARRLAFPKDYPTRVFVEKPPKPAAVEEPAPVIEPEPKPVAREPALMIVDVCAATWGVEADRILGRQQAAFLVRPRQASMVLIRRHTGMSLPQIGRLFRRDHTTVLHSLQRHCHFYESAPDYRARFDAAAGATEGVIPNAR